MKFVVESAGAVASRVRLGSHVILFDQPPVYGGADAGPSPLDVLVASVAACAHYYVSAFLRARGLPNEDVTVEVDAEKVTRPAPRIARLGLQVHVPESFTETELVGMVRAIKRCPAYNTLVSAPAVEMSVDIKRRPRGATPDRRDEHASA
ncbi:MAG TPA: OsmC family protein [Polyangia bacterium]|nr:OsmC family protein [Polyangia bacterium]